MTTHTTLTWHKSSHSKGENNCVETATHPAAVHLRDSTLGVTSPVLTPTAWAGFTTALKNPTTH
jgi:Domain of unknown function (DUF397)